METDNDAMDRQNELLDQRAAQNELELAQKTKAISEARLAIVKSSGQPDWGKRPAMPALTQAPALGGKE